MTLVTLETFVGKLSFSFLFGTMLIYWFRAAFFSSADLWGGRLKKMGFISLFVGNLALVTLLGLRWIISQHFPLSNLYESLIFLSWGISSIHLIIENQTKDNLVGLIFSPITLFINSFATLTLPVQMQKSASLVPALKSNWLMMHVSIMMLSYATLIAGSLIAIAYLIISRNSTVNVNEQSGGESVAALAESGTSYQSSLATTLDNLSYRTLGIGFPLLTLGILSGAVWANEAWGSYWSWDPKETWAFITWLIFAIYFHFRITRGWQGKKSAIVAAVGFVVVWICYLGVNLLGSGLHSYGWLTS